MSHDPEAFVIPGQLPTNLCIRGDRICFTFPTIAAEGMTVSQEDQRAADWTSPWDLDFHTGSPELEDVYQPDWWQPFFDNNHLTIGTPKIFCGGDISFRWHLGKPLSVGLYQDLFHRLAITGLCIYRHNMPRWTIGWRRGHCCVQLDENENIWDIDYVPMTRP